MYRAQISTIHSFCSALLREEGHRLDLDPDFRLCDEGEGAVLMARVLGETLDRQYEDLDPEGDFAALVDTMAAGRDDSRLEQIVLDVFGRIQSHPDPAGWLADQSRLWELGINVGRVTFDEGINLLNQKQARVYRQSPSAEQSIALGQRVDLWLTLDTKKASEQRTAAEKEAARTARERAEREQNVADSLALLRFEQATGSAAEETSSAEGGDEGFFD